MEEREIEKRDVQNMARKDEYEISISQILGIIKQRRLWIYLFFVLALGAAVLYLKITDPTYEASASAMVEPLNNATSIESLLTSTSSSYSKIDTEVQLITSVTNLQSALDRLDLSSYLDPDGVPYSDPEKKLTGKSLAKSVSVKTVNDTKVIQVTVKDKNPWFCADFANAILEAYTEMLTRIAKNSKSAQREFLELQIPETEDLLAEASIELSDYKETSGISQMIQKNTLLTNKIAAFQLTIEPLKLQLIEAGSLMDTLNADKKLPSATTIAKSARIAGLLEDYKANSKELIMYQNVESAEAESQRVYVLQSSLASKEKDILNAIVTLVGSGNSAYAKAVTDYICVNANIEAIESVIDIYNNDLADYPLMERKYLELQRNVEIYEQILLSLRQLLEETKMVEAAVVGNVNIIDSAAVPTVPVSPRKIMILAIAVVGGIALGVMMGLFLEFTDDTIRSEDTIKGIVGKDVPSLGWTPYIRDVDKVKAEFPALFVLTDPDASISERFRAISNNIVYSLPKKIKVISINSTDMSEGKTTVICNVAASYAMAGKKVLLIDGDFRKPAIEAFFGLRRSKVGLVDAVISHVPLDKCIIRPTEKVPNLHILPPGSGTRNPNALYNSEKFHTIIDRLRAVYDYVIIDCPPLSYGSEFTHLSKHLDGFVLNVRAGVSSKRALASFIADLEFLRAPLLGFIYYGVVARNQSHYGYYGYYGGYGYGNKRYGYGKYGYAKYGYGYGYTGHKSLYEEGRGSYRSLHIRELKRRSSVTYGKREPVLAFAGGIDAAFSSANSIIRTQMKHARATVSAEPQAKPEAEEQKADAPATAPAAQTAPATPATAPATPAPAPAAPAAAPVTTEDEAKKKTSDMLAEIEEFFAKKQPDNTGKDKDDKKKS
jgi:capsular exopolysaccharide synthesis family protein